MPPAIEALESRTLMAGDVMPPPPGFTVRVTSVEEARKYQSAGDTNILFPRGEVFTITDDFDLYGKNSGIGAYGDSRLPPPIFRGSTDFITLHRDGQWVSRIRFESTGGSPRGVVIQAHNAYVGGNEFIGLARGVDVPKWRDGDKKWHGAENLKVEANTFTDCTEYGIYATWTLNYQSLENHMSLSKDAPAVEKPHLERIEEYRGTALVKGGTRVTEERRQKDGSKFLPSPLRAGSTHPSDTKAVVEVDGVKLVGGQPKFGPLGDSSQRGNYVFRRCDITHDKFQLYTGANAKFRDCRIEARRYGVIDYASQNGKKPAAKIDIARCSTFSDKRFIDYGKFVAKVGPDVFWNGVKQKQR